MPRRTLWVIFGVVVVSVACYERADHNRYGRWFAEALETVDRQYLEAVAGQKLIEGAVEGMVRRLDDYSAFLPASETRQLEELLDQQYGGIGIEVNLEGPEKQLTITNPLAGTPAYKVGLLSGDKIMAVDGRSTQNLPLKEIVGLLRGRPGQAVALRDLGVIGVGLGGDESRFPPELYERAYAIARDGGLHGVAHAGEAAGAASVRAAVEVLGAERIGHGVRAMEDPAVVDLLAERRIPLEICPTSNRLTGAAPPGAVHPLGALDAAGCIVTIDADDPALFGTTLIDEYRYVAETFGDDAILRYARNAIEASFASPVHQARLRELFERSRNSVPAGRTP